jgi:hypothetical protein
MMDEKTAKAIVAGLIEGAEVGSSPQMTPEMLEALRIVTRKAFGETLASSKEEPVVQSVVIGDSSKGGTETEERTAAGEEIVIDSRSLILQGPESPDTLLCLDFGTAMSKAFAIASSNGNIVPIDLPLGKVAGEPNVIYPVSSSIWIADDGLIFFGYDAVRKSLTHGRRPRLDSLKQYLSQGDVPSLTHLVIDEERNPSGVKLNLEDILTLYLSYLTDIACSALEGRGFSRYVRRRFALPPWEAGRRAECEKLLQNLLARAQLIADHFHGQWGGGIPAKSAKQVIDKVKTLSKLPFYLLDRGVSEPLAAAQGRLGFDNDDKLIRGLAVVIDVGAGTSDLGLFHVNRKTGSNAEILAIPICQRTLKQAGDFVDECLRKFILRTANISNSAPDFQLINGRLALDIRQFKERLFTNLSLIGTLSNSTSVNITLGQFLAEPEVQGFSDRLCQEFDELLNDKTTLDWIRTRASAGLLVVFTGGGADLPMVQQLVNHKCDPHAITIHNRAAARTSRFIEMTYPALVPEYPQLAVAIGGAHPNLPEEASAGPPSASPSIVSKPSWTGS